MKPKSSSRTTPAPDDTDQLPDVTTFEVTRKPNGWWRITACQHHIGCYLIGRDLRSLMHEAPSALNQLLKLDGPIPAPELANEQ